MVFHHLGPYEKGNLAALRIDETAKKDLRIIFGDSERIRRLLEEQEIPFGEVE